MDKRSIIEIIVVVVLAVVFLAGSIFWFTKPARYGKPEKVSALFVGNSFTYVNDLPKTTADIAASLGDRLDYDMSAPGGYLLMQHAYYQPTLDKIKSKPWDFVILQEQSQAPALAADYVDKYVIPYAAQLDKTVHLNNPQTKIVFFETWGYENGDSDNCAKVPGVCDYAGMQARLQQAYAAMAQNADGEMAPVGDAWNYIRKTHPEIELYQSDGKHPSPAGTYLAACVFYATLFKKEAVGAASLTINPLQARILQEAAQKIVFDE